jgi:hypothetical protein
MTLLNDAIEYAELGFSVVPVRRKEKFPHVKWTDFQERRATEEELEAWWEQWPDANVGFITGAISNVVVIDADTPERVKWLRENFITSVFQATGRDSGGLHGFYRPNGQPVKTIAGALPGIDIKGDGGFSVLAPSVHKTGRIYALEYTAGFDGWDDLADFPYNIFPNEKQTEIKPPVTREAVTQGTRNETLTRLAGRYCKKKLDYDEVLVLCNAVNVTYNPPLPACDVEKICKSIYGSEHKSDTVYEVMTRDDIGNKGMSLDIPDDLIESGGLIDLGIKGLVASECPNILQYNMPIILSYIANSIAGKIRFKNTWPNLYNIKVGGTSTGKSESNITIKMAISFNKEIVDFFGPSDIPSGQGLCSYLTRNPRCLGILDEITYLFKHYDKHNAIRDGIVKVLLELFSSSGIDYNSPYSNQANDKQINSPCFSLLGNATPLIFDSINLEDMMSGAMQRFDFWVYDGMPMFRTESQGTNQDLEFFCLKIAQLHKKRDADNVFDLLSVFDCCNNITFTKERKNFSDQIIQMEIDAKKKGSGEDVIGIIARQYDLAFKYGMIHMASERNVNDLYKPMELADFVWGKKVAKMLCSWKINTLCEKVTSGDYHRATVSFIEGLTACLKNPRTPKPTFAQIANRRKDLLNWPEMYSAGIIKNLIRQERIATEEIGGHTRYLLLKQTI